MRLSLVFELLLIFVLLAFAASRVIESKSNNKGVKVIQKVSKKRQTGSKNQRQTSSSNRYCSCSAKLCNCCREFNIPVVALQGPGCASLQYLSGDKLAITMSFGERVLANTTISARRPRPVCMPLPGGVSKFCGRIYNIGRQGEDFKACLGLELRALDNVEASLRVSCFRFGPKGLKVEPAQPLPVVPQQVTDESDETDDEYDFDDDDDDDYDIEGEGVDYEAFSLLDDDFIGGFFGSDSDDQGEPIKKVVSSTTKPPLKKTNYKRITTKAPQKLKKKPLRKATTSKPVTLTKRTTTPSNQINEIPVMENIAVNEIEGSAVPTVDAAETVLSQKNTSEHKLENGKPTEVSINSILSSDITQTTNVALSQNEIVTEENEKAENYNTITASGEDSSLVKVENEEISSTTEKGANNEDPSEESSEEDDEDDEDPITSAVDEVLDEEEDEEEEEEGDKTEEEEKTTTIQPDQLKETNKKKVKKEESDEEDPEDDIDEVVDGVLDTVTGEDDEEEESESARKSNKGNVENSESKEFGKRKVKPLREKRVGVRQSKDMRLEML